MEDYPLPAPLVGMLRASKLTGKPIVKTELLSTKLHVTISWDLATSAPRKPKNCQSTKTAKPAPANRQPAKSLDLQPVPAPTVPAPAPPAPPVREPCPETLPPKVAAGRVGLDWSSHPIDHICINCWLPVFKKSILEKSLMGWFNPPPPIIYLVTWIFNIDFFVYWEPAN